jgi:hypothetical protein
MILGKNQYSMGELAEYDFLVGGRAWIDPPSGAFGWFVCVLQKVLSVLSALMFWVCAAKTMTFIYRT